MVKILIIIALSLYILKALMGRPENRDRQWLLSDLAENHESLPIVSLQLSTECAAYVTDMLVKEGLPATAVRD